MCHAKQWPKPAPMHCVASSGATRNILGMSLRHECHTETDGVVTYTECQGVLPPLPDPLPCLACMSGLTVLVQDLCYSDPLSSVLTISDPTKVRDDLFSHCSTLELVHVHTCLDEAGLQSDRSDYLPVHSTFLTLHSPHLYLLPVHSHIHIYDHNNKGKRIACSYF